MSQALSHISLRLEAMTPRGDEDKSTRFVLFDIREYYSSRSNVGRTLSRFVNRMVSLLLYTTSGIPDSLVMVVTTGAGWRGAADEGLKMALNLAFMPLAVGSSGFKRTS